MAVAIDKAGNEDHVRSIDHLHAGRIDIRRNRRDFRAFNQHVAPGEVTYAAIHADDRPALEQYTLPGIERRLRTKSFAGFDSECGSGRRTSSGGKCEPGACEQRFTA